MKLLSVRRRPGGLLVFGHVLLAALALAGCAAQGGTNEGKRTPEDTGALRVFAAASLGEAFPRIEPTAAYNFAGSDTLATQIREGAPADIFASANVSYADQLFREGLVEVPVVFAGNRLVLVVPGDNPAKIMGVADLAKPDIRLVIAAEGVPVGDYTRELLDRLNLSTVLKNVVSSENDASGVLAKISLGEGDAGFVYATDAATAGVNVRAFEVPPQAQPSIQYKIAVVSSSDNKDAAYAFLDSVLSEEGQRALEAAGFSINPCDDC